jgi:hypothetical protein
VLDVLGIVVVCVLIVVHWRTTIVWRSRYGDAAEFAARQRWHMTDLERAVTLVGVIALMVILTVDGEVSTTPRSIMAAMVVLSSVGLAMDFVAGRRDPDWPG